MKAVLSTVGVFLWKYLNNTLEEGSGSVFEPLRKLLYCIQIGNGNATPTAEVFKDYSPVFSIQKQETLASQLIKRSPEIKSLMKIAENMALTYEKNLAHSAWERAMFLALVRAWRERKPTDDSRLGGPAKETVPECDVFRHYQVLLPKQVSDEAAKSVWRVFRTSDMPLRDKETGLEFPELTLHYALAASDTDEGEQAARLIDSLLRNATVLFYHGQNQVAIRVRFCPVDETELSRKNDCVAVP